MTAASTGDARAIANTFETLLLLSDDSVPAPGCPSALRWVTAQFDNVYSMSFDELKAYVKTGVAPQPAEGGPSKEVLLHNLGRHAASIVLDTSSVSVLREHAQSTSEHRVVLTGWLYGGTRLQCDAVPKTTLSGPRPCTLGDLWAFRIVISPKRSTGSVIQAPSASITWVHVAAAATDGGLPNARTHHGAVMVGYVFSLDGQASDVMFLPVAHGH